MTATKDQLMEEIQELSSLLVEGDRYIPLLSAEQKVTLRAALDGLQEDLKTFLKEIGEHA